MVRPGIEPDPPAQQTGALPTRLIRRQKLWKKTFFRQKPTSDFQEKTVFQSENRSREEIGGKLQNVKQKVSEFNSFVEQCYCLTLEIKLPILVPIA